MSEMGDKAAINARFLELYDAGRAAAEHGFYETVFRAMHEAYAPFVEAKIAAAFVRGVEWGEENPLDREYRFKAAADHADAALSPSES